MRRKGRWRPAGPNGRLQGGINSRKPATATSAKKSKQVPAAIVAQLVGGRCTAVGLGLGAWGSAPCLALCRKLIAHGVPPETPLAVYRGEVLALRIRTVGEGAQLTVVERPDGPRFERWKAFSRAA